MVNACLIDGCDSPVKGRGYCTKHYTRLRRFGDPLREPARRSREGVCDVDGCESPVRAKRMCNLHYNRTYATGDPGPAQRLRRPFQQLCSLTECRRPHVAQGYCEPHYESLQKYGDPHEVSRRRKAAKLTCAAPGCDRPTRSKGLVDRGGGPALCGMHSQRMRKFGQFDLPERKPRVSKGYINNQGYRIVSFGGRVIQEHRLVMEQAIGRELTADETVHHKNGVRHDNRLENLELWSGWQPPGQRVTDKVAWARQIIDRYGSLVDEGVIT